MPIQIVMDRSGDTRHEFDAADLARAEERFRDLTKRVYIAVALGKNGAENTLLRTFDPQVDRTLFIPRLEGG